MNAAVNKLAGFVKEVWRRNVFHIAIPYGIVSWLLIQIADTVLPAFDTPAWVFKSLLIALVVGFPVAIVIAWVFDIGPRGLVRTDDEDQRKANPEVTNSEESNPGEPEPVPALSMPLENSERRRVSMLNCTLHIDSVDEEELDPEELASLLTGIENIFQGIVDQYEGYRLPGHPEELSIVFGYPNAHEDDARRAVAAGLATLAKIRAMLYAAIEEGEVSVIAHAGVHSGLVVFDDAVTDAKGVSIIGRVPRTTSWLQSTAPANSLVVSQQTHRLVSSNFSSEDLGAHEAAQLGGQLHVFLIDAALKPGDKGKLEQHQAIDLVGRDHELHLLDDRWESVLEGDGQFALVKGGPGMGKTTVVNAFLQHVKQTGKVWFLPWYCSPYEQHSEFYPLIQFLKDHWFGFEEQDSDALKLEKMELGLAQHKADLDIAIPLLANLMSLDLPSGSGYLAPSATSQTLRKRGMQYVIDIIRAAAISRPVCLLVEDLHWIDPSTLEMLEMILDYGPSKGIFLLMTSRPELPADWGNRSYILTLDLHHLSRRAARQLVIKTATDREFPDRLIQRVVDETEGNPMFVEELTLALLESDTWRNSQELADLHIPATLQESFAARVDNLGSAKALLQLCSVLGRDFNYRLLLAVSETANEAALQQELDRIVKAELLFKKGTETDTAYTFKHVLIQQAAYQSLLKSSRKTLHKRIAEILESQFTDIAAERPQQLAYHYAAGGMAEKAIAYWTAASRRSVTRSANLEAIEQARNGLELVLKLPESNARNEMEVPLQSVLGTALLGSRGYTAPEVRDVFTRARELCEQIDNTEQLFQIVVGLWMYYVVGARYEEALDIGSQLLRIAKAGGNAGQQVQAHYTIGYTQFYRGEFEAARQQFELALSAEEEGGDHSSQSASADDTRTHVRCMMAHTCWHLGLPVTAARYAQAATELAHQLEQPYAITFISFFNAWHSQLRHEARSAKAHADECLQLAEENGYVFFIPVGSFIQAWAELQLAREDSGSQESASPDRMKTAMEMCLSSGVGTGNTYFRFQLAEELLELGMYAEIPEQLKAGWQHLENTGERFLESEYYRLNGCLCLARFGASEDQSDLDQAIDFLQQGLSCAKSRNSKGLQLRAATDLAVALAQNNSNELAVESLAKVIDGFEEFDNSGDCQRAREVLAREKSN